MAARSLFSYAPQGAVLRLLIKAYGTEQSADVRSWIVYSLFSARDEAVDTVLKALATDPSDVVRSRAAQRLSSPHYAKHPKVADTLLKALKEDKSVEVRRRAAEAIGAMPLLASTEEVLLGCLGDKDIGPHCALGLGRLGSQKGYTAVRDLLQKGETSTTLSPLFVWAITDFQSRPFFELEVISGILRRIVKAEKAQAGTRHYAVKSLVKLAQAVPDRKAATAAFLKPLENDALLTHSVKPALEQLTAKPAAAPAN
jgi:HEAT repeat protein